jgi:hypothetical protein
VLRQAKLHEFYALAESNAAAAVDGAVLPQLAAELPSARKPAGEKARGMSS